jgi:hypothetical protein
MEMDTYRMVISHQRAQAELSAGAGGISVEARVLWVLSPFTGNGDLLYIDMRYRESSYTYPLGSSQSGYMFLAYRPPPSLRI